MRFRAAALLGLVAVVAFLSPEISVHAAAHRVRAADLRSDARLQRKVKFDGQVLPLWDVVAKLDEEADTSILIQGDLLKRPVSISVKGQAISEVMEQLALLFGGAWILQDDAYILLTDEVTANLVTSHPNQGGTGREEAALLGGIGGPELSRMAQGRPLKFEEMSPGQQRAALAIARDRFLREPARYPSSIVSGKGLVCMIIYVLEGDDNPAHPQATGMRPASVDLMAPSISDNGVMAPASLATRYLPR